MSDIYLSLTETPAVVTLSQPVIATQVAATVTVGNTVTVALDANSLSALEQVTVTVGAAVNIGNVVSVNVVTMPAINVSGGLTDAELRAGAVTVAVSNFPASSSVTIGGFSTFSLPPSTVTVGNSVTINGTVTANNPGALTIVNSSTVTKGDVKFTAIAGAYNPTDVAPNYTLNPISVDAKGISYVDGQYVNYRDSCVAELQGQGGPAWKAQLIASSVTVSNSVTIGSLPAISGTVTANTAYEKYANIYQSPPSNAVQLGFADSGNFFVNVRHNNGLPVRQQEGSSVTIGSLPTISGTVTANVGFSSNVGEAIPEQAVLIAYNTNNFMEAVGENMPLPIIGTVTVGNSITIGSFATSVTARLVDISGTAVSYASTGTAGTPSSDVISVQGVSGGTSLPISGTAGSLTTRFGSVTTAGTAQISSAVTNASRRYLLIQNVTTSSNVITIGIGFTPTTTQGIQLSAGAGITFESSYIPTGAVYILSGVTASPFTILEA